MRDLPAGTITALPTPFDGDALDLRALAALVDGHVRDGCGMLATGTATGEAPTLGPDERRALVAACVQAASGRVPVLAGIVGSSTARCAEAAVEARESGADGVLISTPAYNKPTPEGLLRHLAAVSEATDLPLVVHNVPARSVVDIRPETAVRLLAIGTVAGIVDASPDPGRIAAWVEASRGRLAVFGGGDGSALTAGLAGARGHLSLLANLAPRACSAFRSACEARDWERAAGIGRRLRPLAEVIGREPDPSPVKYALSRRHAWFPADVRLPMVPVSAETAAAISRAMDACAEPMADEPSRAAVAG